MRKIIKRKIHISTHKRDLIDFINDEFYSHDKHNAFLEFTMKSLPTDNIIALFYFQKTKRYIETKAFVDGDKFTIEFDTSLINTDETVLGFIYFEKVAQSADVHRFSFGVKVSEIDKLHDIPIEEAKTKRVVAIEDIVTKAELDELFKQIEKNGGTYNDTEIRNSITSIEERVHTLENKTDKDTVYDDSDVKNRLSTLESNSSRYLTEHQSLTSVEERIQQVEARFNNLSNIYLSSHQSLEHLATKDALDKVEQRVEQLESKPEIDVTNFATNSKVTAVESRVLELENKSVVTHEELEAKHYLTSVPEEYAKKSELYNDSALTERVSLLEAKAISNGAYDDKPLLDKIHAIEEQFRNASNLYLQSHQSLEHLVTKKELEAAGYLNEHQSLEGYAKKTELYNDSELREKITALETNSVTHAELASKNYLIEHQPLTDYATNSKVEAVENRVLALENKPSIDTNEFAKKSEIPQAYDDSALSGRVSALEAKQDKDTIYNDEEIKRRLTTLEGKPTVDVSNFAKKTEVPTIDSVNNLLRTQGEQSVKINALEAKAGYEIHGTGMPNGQVSAPIGTTYVDMNVTNGALKWIKRTGTENTGWQVLTGDTGWRTLPLINKRGNAKLQVRRINDQVIVKFDGLSWGWFGVDDIDKQEKAGNIVDKNIGGKKYTWINLNIGRGSNVLSVGFRSASSTLAGLYGNLGDLLGSVYVGGTADQNAIQLRYAMPKSELNNTILSQIRISPVTFITDDEWPTTLP